MADLVIYNSANRITQHYGGSHHGVDLGWSSNENHNYVYSNCSGTVVEVVDGMDNNPGATGTASWGNYVLIRHSNGYYSRYAHLKKYTIVVTQGQTVTNTQLLGVMGDSGNAYGRHLHFEVATGYSSSTRINPEPYLTATIDGSTGINVPSTPPSPPHPPLPPAPFPIPDKKFNFVLFNNKRRSKLYEKRRF